MTKGQKIGGFIGVVVLAIVGVVVKLFMLDSSAPIDQATDKKSPMQPATEKKQVEAVTVPENGKKLSINGSYKSPAGAEQIGFIVVIDKDGVVTGAEAIPMAENEKSVMFQGNFAKAFPGVVTGKKLSDLEKIDRTGGASLTTGAFNIALASLKADL